MLFRYSTLTILWAIILAILLLVPGDKFPKEEVIVNVDKLVHFGIFGLFSFLFVNAFKNSKTHFVKSNLLVFSFFMTFGYSILLESLQNFVPMRQFDLIDVLANGIGVVLGLILFAIIYRF